ncbi:hypothetical protein FRC17_002651, partial [Serendipita sp. 399]
MDPTTRQTTIEEANVAHFDKFAQNYDDNPFVNQIAKQVVDLIRNKVALSEESTIMLDYACGTGQISRKSEPFVKKVIGVDISQGMVDQYNQRASDQAIPPEKMQAVCIPRLQGDNSDLDGQKFDIIVCAQAYHHFSDINKVTKDLTNLLKPGTGRLFIADLMQYDRGSSSQSEENDGAVPHSHHHHHHYHHHQAQNQHHHHHPHHNSHTQSNPIAPIGHHEPFSGPSVAHHGGFTSDQITTVLESVGLQDVEFIPNA